MLSSARKTRVCPLRVTDKTDRLSLGHRYRSATSSLALGALPESLWPATKTARGLGTETTQVQFPNWLATSLLPASESCHYGQTQRSARRMRVCPLRVAGKT